VYVLVCPDTGETEWLIAPTVNMAWFNLALVQFAKAVGAGPNKRVVLVLDGAGWHTGKRVVVPEGAYSQYFGTLFSRTSAPYSGSRQQVRSVPFSRVHRCLLNHGALSLFSQYILTSHSAAML